MRQGTYRIAYDEAVAELSVIVEQFEELRLRKEQIEKVVEALKPFLAPDADISAAELEAVFAKSETVLPVSQAVIHSFGDVPGAPAESMQAVEIQADPVPVAVEVTPEPDGYFRQPSVDPFQRRIDDALWGWQQRPEGLLSPI